MIDLNDIRANAQAYREACRKKRINFDVDKFLEIDTQYRTTLTQVEQSRSQKNAVSKEIQKLSGAERERRIQDMRAVSKDLDSGEERLKELESEWKRLQLFVPSIPLARVPEGKDDSENVEIRTWGEVPAFNFKIKDHVELGKQLDIIDIERGVKVAGARSYFIKGDAVRLQHALFSYAMDFMRQRNYLLMDPPHIVRFEAMIGTGYFPGGEESAYILDERDKDFALIGTSEVPVAAYHLDELLQLNEVPKRYSGYSPCYRREAGTYGKDTHGIYRVHQFYKVEQVVICRADEKESAAFHAELLKNSEDFVQSLEIAYRVVDVCTGDMGQGQVYKNDVECWMPSRNAYGETHSCSSFHEFQARRLNLRYKDESGKNRYCHTLNNTLVSSARTLIAILENNQQEDGSVRIPKILQPYMGGQILIEPVKR